MSAFGDKVRAPESLSCLATCGEMQGRTSTAAEHAIVAHLMGVEDARIFRDDVIVTQSSEH
jgi:hypothetical protein